LRRKVKELINYLKYSSKIARNLNIIEGKTSIVYKTFFVIPKVSLKVKIGKTHNGWTEASKIYISINGKRLSGSIFFWPEIDLPEDILDDWIAQRVTKIINSFDSFASRDRRKAKELVEKYFKVKVKEL